MGLQIAASEYHERAVEQRIEKKAQEKGYAPYGGPSGEGVLYDIGSWLLDPFNDADKKVPIDRRFNVSVWRANLRKVANEKKPGETIEFTWQVGLNKFDFWGNQEIEDVQVVYRKGDDGRWTPVSGARSDIPDFNKIISTEVPDSEIEMRLQQGPTTA
jgi:hypothetical protein